MENFKFEPKINPHNEESSLNFFSDSNEAVALESILKRNVNLKRLVKLLSTPMDFIKELFKIADENLNLTSVNEMLSVTLFIGTNIGSIISSVKAIKDLEEIKNNKMPSEMHDIIKEILSKVAPGSKIIEMSSGRILNGEDENRISKYTYKLDSRLFIDDIGTEEHVSVTNNIENVLNEIIKKEGFAIIQTKRIFAKGSDNVVSEIHPKYEKELCVDASFEPLND